MKIDKQIAHRYTEDDLNRVAQLAAQTAIREMLHGPPNLDNGIAEACVCPSEREEDMGSPYRETYTYFDQYGNTLTVRFNGKNKQDTDAKFQEFLCGPKKKNRSITQ